MVDKHSSACLWWKIDNTNCEHGRFVTAPGECDIFTLFQMKKHWLFCTKHQRRRTAKLFTSIAKEVMSNCHWILYHVVVILMRSFLFLAARVLLQRCQISYYVPKEIKCVKEKPWWFFKVFSFKARKFSVTSEHEYHFLRRTKIIWELKNLWWGPKNLVASAHSRHEVSNLWRLVACAQSMKIVYFI